MINQISDINIFLNHNELTNINPEQVFDHGSEEFLNETFAQAQQIKMQEGVIRSISMTISTYEGGYYQVYLYLREGNRRLTRMPYEQTIDLLIDWCWLYSSIVTTNDAEQNIISKRKKTALPEQCSESQSSDNVSLTQTDTKEQTKSNDIGSNNENIKNVGLENNYREESDNITFINALHELVEMKKQGFLTDKEFTDSKAKIIKELTQADKR